MKSRHRKKRRGAAIVELAITLPVFVLILMGTIEATSMIFLQQSLQIAAYEGARISLVPTSELENVNEGCHLILTGRGVDNFTTSVSPSSFPTQPYGTAITVTVTAPCADNSLFTPWFYAGKTLTADCTMMKEF